MQVISLKNMKGIPMSVPNGEGGLIALAPGEEKLVNGDYEYFHRMPGQGMNGLVVKVASGEKVRLVESTVNDVVMATVTNHRRIPLLLATGIGQSKVNIPAGETSLPTKVRLSIVKQMNGISVKVVEEKKAPVPSTPATEVVKVEAPGKLKNGADVAAIAEAVKVDEAELERKRKDLAMPATRAEWNVHKDQLTWPDVRGLCKDLNIKTKSSSKEELLEEISRVLYPS